jgi:hypothetical protein
VRLGIHVRHTLDEAVLERLDRLICLLERKEDAMSVALDELNASMAQLEQRVSEANTAMGSAALLIQGLADEIRNAAASAEDLDGLRQRLNNITGVLDTQGDALAEAVAANTPDAQQPEPEAPVPNPAESPTESGATPPLEAEALPGEFSTSSRNRRE